MLPIDTAWPVLKTKPDLTSLSPPKPDLNALSSPSAFTEMTENESRSRGRLCEFCGQRQARKWTSQVPPGRHQDEGHVGMYFGQCRQCSDLRKPEWTWTSERAERGY